MNKRFLTILTGLSISLATSLFAEKHATWGYEGVTGATQWAELAPENALCASGKNQSPVNIDTTNATNIDQDALEFDYSMLIPDKIKNNGHTIQIDMGMGNTVKIDGKTFELKQFHFHSPSENTVNGKSFPFEAHFVHANKEGELLVVAMLFVPGNADNTLTELWKSMPQKAGDENRLGSSVLKSLETEMKATNYYRFNGSLTTPPCSEGVRWFVMKAPMTIAKEQVKAFEDVMGHANNRPVQKTNARLILE